jgi:hypothetical protein
MKPTEIIPYATADGIRQLVPIEDFETVAAEAAQLRANNAELRRIVEWWESLRSESRGVDGYHRNGDVATWDELDPPSHSAALPVRPNAAECGQCADNGLPPGYMKAEDVAFFLDEDQ